MSETYSELPGCTHAQFNQISQDYWCKLRSEFCMYIKRCPAGYTKGVAR